MDDKGAQSTSFLDEGVGCSSAGVLLFGRGCGGQRSWPGEAPWAGVAGGVGWAIAGRGN